MPSRPAYDVVLKYMAIFLLPLLDPLRSLLMLIFFFDTHYHPEEIVRGSGFGNSRVWVIPWDNLVTTRIAIVLIPGSRKMIKGNTSSRKRERCSGVRNRFRFSESLAARIKTQDGIAVGSAVVEIFSEINGLSESITHFVPFPGEVRVSIHFTALAINKLLQSFWGGSTRRSLDAHK
jgi:hypothetical protein